MLVSSRLVEFRRHPSNCRKAAIQSGTHVAALAHHGVSRFGHGRFDWRDESEGRRDGGKLVARCCGLKADIAEFSEALRMRGSLPSCKGEVVSTQCARRGQSKF